MPIGLLVPVVLVGWGTACALTCWRRLGAFARVPASVVNELPFAAGYLLIASIALALAQGELDSVGGAVIGVAAVVVLIGLAVIVRRALRADHALGNAGRRRGPGRESCERRCRRSGVTSPGPATSPTVRDGAAPSMSTVAVTGLPANRSCCTSMAVPSTPETRTVKPGR
jgi:hypothetical protein